MNSKNNKQNKTSKQANKQTKQKPKQNFELFQLTLRRALLLAVEHVLLGLLEVVVGDLLAALTQRHQSGLGADRLIKKIKFM